MSTRSTRLIAGEVVILALACIAAAVDSEAADWEPPELFVVLLVLAIIQAAYLGRRIARLIASGHR